jgi:hypothetical protein
VHDAAPTHTMACWLQNAVYATTTATAKPMRTRREARTANRQHRAPHDERQRERATEHPAEHPLHVRACRPQAILEVELQLGIGADDRAEPNPGRFASPSTEKCERNGVPSVAFEYKANIARGTTAPAGEEHPPRSGPLCGPARRSEATARQPPRVWRRRRAAPRTRRPTRIPPP